MTLEEAIRNREDCLKYLEGLGRKACLQNVEAVGWSVKALKFMQRLAMNDAAPMRWYYGDCEDWEWRGVQKEEQ